MRFRKKIQRRLQEKARALYVRMPHVIRKEEDVAKLFTGDFKVQLTRQAKRYCYVVFSSEEEKLKNLKAAKGTLVDGKQVLIAPANTSFEKDTKTTKKKIVVPKVQEDKKVTKTLFVSNIKCGTKSKELKEAIPGCVSVKMLKPYTQHSRGAIVKMESIIIASEYLSKTREPPIVAGRKLRMNVDTRIKNKKPKSEKPLKIYDGEPEKKESPKKKRKKEKLDHIVLENKT